jgi:pyridoxine 5-phosphate synthase
MTSLSVNINKIALLRNSRGRDFPSVLEFARRCLELGAHGITLHPRPDQRHARYSDVTALLPLVREFGRELNVEGNPAEEFLDVVLRARPDQCTLVPDDPNQLTSDHGWNLERDRHTLRDVIARLKDRDIRVSLFVDHDYPHIELARELGADRVELYTFLTIPGILEVSIGHALIAECIESGVGEVIPRYVSIVSNSAPG